MKPGAAFLVWVWIAMAAAADTPRADRLCFGDECRSYACGEELPTGDSRRTFTFSRSRADHRLGILEAGAATASCDADGAVELQIKVLERATQDIVVRVTSRVGDRWELRFAENELRNPIVLHMSPGSYDIAVETAHFVSHRATVEIAQKTVPLVAQLRPLRTISGTVVDAAGGVVDKAQVRSETNGDAITGRDGRFALELDPEQWPDTVTLSADGFGSRLVAVPRARANASLGTIELQRGTTVTAEIHQTEPGQVVAVELLRLRNDAKRPDRVVQRKELPQSALLDRSIRFEAVEPGNYVAIATGGKPADRAGERVDVGTADLPPVHVLITPYHLLLRTLRDGEPFGGARVILRHHEAFWESAVDVDPMGQTNVRLWQTGPLSATVESPGSVPYRSRRTIADPADTEWPLEMPPLEITGDVIDAESRTPVANAAVALEMTSEDQGRHLSVSTTADSQGRFRFGPVFPGEHTIRAVAADYPASEVTYSFGEEDESRALTIVLQRMPMTHLSVVDARARPLAGVDVFVFQGSMQVAFGRTDSSGKWPVFIPRGETRDVFAVPRDGSLGALRIASGTPDLSLVLREPSSSIVVRAETDGHEPIARISLDVRFDGFLLPFEVLQALTARGARTTSDASGRMVLNHMPPGVYELWPAPARPGNGSARIVAVPGENLVVLTFAP